MKKIDDIILKITYKISNWTYRKFSLDNIKIGLIFIFIGLIFSILIAIDSFNFAQKETFEIARVRKASAIFGVGFFLILSFFSIISNKFFKDILERHYDLDKADYIRNNIGIFFRWIMILPYFIASPFNRSWIGNFDLFCVGIALFFISTNPPDMNERIKKSFKLSPF